MEENDMSNILKLREKRNTIWNTAKDFLDSKRGADGMVSAEDAHCNQKQYNRECGVVFHSVLHSTLETSVFYYTKKKLILQIEFCVRLTSYSIYIIEKLLLQVRVKIFLIYYHYFYCTLHNIVL